jgi:Domain of unknown function (DUF4190)
MSSEGQPPPDPDGQQPGWGQQPPPPPPPGQGWGGGYAPPPQGQYGYVRQDHPRATTALVLGIVGLVLCGLAAPFAWRIGKNAVDEIDRSQGTLGGRGQAYAGQILGLIGTILLVVGIVALLGILVLGVASVSTSP